MFPSRSTRAVLLALGVALAAATQTASATSLGMEHRTSMRAKASGTVTAIDAAARQLTVRGPRGEAVYRVDPKVQGLDAIKVGDAVRVDYVAGVGLTLRRGSKEVPEAAAPDKVGQRTTILTRVVAVDRSAGTLRLKGPGGNANDYPVADKADLAGIRVGDQVVVAIYELVAVGVVPGKR
jgi:Cu/Ag efflux protein CusF